MIKARFNWYAYLSFFFVLLFLSGSIYLLANPQIVLKSKTGPTSSPTLVGFIIFLLTIFLFYVLAKVIYLVTVSNETIRLKGVFKKVKISFTQIKSINLFSKENFYWSAGSTTLGIRIELENGQHWVIGDPFYNNIDKVKSALYENFKEKIQPFQKSKKAQTNQNIFENDFEKFAGNPITSINGILLIGIMVALVGIVLNKSGNLELAHIFMIIPFTMFYLGFGYQLNYFLLSNKRLVVKNHCLPWIKREFDIDKIAIVSFEKPHKRSQALRITTTDFKSKLYSAGSLRDKHWIQLKEKLESSGITIV